MDTRYISTLRKLAGEEAVLADEPMSRHTSFKIGGPADAFVQAADEEAVEKVLSFCGTENIPCFIMGNGSNLLVSDDGYRGVILQIGRSFSAAEREGKSLRARAGISLSSLAAIARNEGLSGLEFASGIPGTLGGALFMNAGAYGGEMKDVVREVKVLFPDGHVDTLGRAALNMGYRSSRIKEDGLVVLSAVLDLAEDDRDAISARMADLAQKRKDKQPLEYPSAGSTFKRPEGYFAGKLIMDAGLRGERRGGACVSEKHCGFIINTGNATASDVYSLMREVRSRVQAAFGVILEPEVQMLGMTWE